MHLIDVENSNDHTDRADADSGWGSLKRLSMIIIIILLIAGVA